jgi:hypothetical protein
MLVWNKAKHRWDLNHKYLYIKDWNKPWLEIMIEPIPMAAAQQQHQIMTTLMKREVANTCRHRIIIQHKHRAGLAKVVVKTTTGK